MPSLPDIPGKNLVTDTTKRAKVIAGAASAGAVAVGGLVAKRVLGGHGEKDTGVDSDPIAQTPTAPPDAVEKPAPPTKAATPKPPKAKVEAPAAPPKPAKAKPAPKGKVETKPPTAKPDPKPKAKAAPKETEAKPAANAKAAPKPKAKAAPKPKPAAKPKAPAKTKAKAKPKAAKPPKTTGTDAPPKPSVEPGNISGDKEPHHALNNPVRDPDETEYPDPFEKRDDPRDPVDPDGEPFGEEPHPSTGSESTSEPPLSQDPAISDGGKPPKREKLDD